jgi:hypothetical protein
VCEDTKRKTKTKRSGGNIIGNNAKDITETLKNVSVKDGELDRKVITDYLKNGVVKNHKVFFKAKNIAKDLDMSPKEVGSNLKLLSDNPVSDLRIEKWSYSKSTTWKVGIADEPKTAM